MLLKSLPHSIFSSPRIHYSMNIAGFKSLVSCLWTLNLPVSFAIKSNSVMHMLAAKWSTYLQLWVLEVELGLNMSVFQKACTNVTLHLQCEILKSSNWGVRCEPQETPEGVASFSDMEKPMSEPQVKHRKQDKRTSIIASPLWAFCRQDSKQRLVFPEEGRQL